MEEHRLKPMPDQYDQNLFNKLYKETQLLRNKLVYNIDARRFGVDSNEIASWFDVKFIFVFSKYYKEFKDEPGVLKGHLINALQLFKYRVLKEAYMDKNKQYLNKIEIQEIEYFEALISTEEETEREENHNHLLSKILSFLKSKLTDDAFLIFELQLNPPPFILHRLESLSNQRSGSIPNDILADYLGLIPNRKVISYIAELKKEIKVTVESAKEYFQNPELAIS